MEETSQKQVTDEEVDDINKSVDEQIRLLEKHSKDVSEITPQQILTSVFGHNGFKPQQDELIEHILEKRGHALAVMPTGGGKSLCFQLPALKQKNVTIVVSPLIALMKDQIDGLVKKKIYSAFFINSSLSEENKTRILKLTEQGFVKLLYVAPESLNSDKILDVLRNVNVDLFVIDEAHCISVWGHDFRPDYLKLAEIIKQLDNPPVLALTATATSTVKEDIQKQLGIKCKLFIASFDRPNLYIHTTELEPAADKEKFLLDLLKQLEGPTIIFVSYTKTAMNIAEYLTKNGIKAIFYHGHMKKEDKEKNQNDFMTGKENIIVCTIAFGMGVDKKNIRNIIHFNVAQSIENYYQEIGRAGRDGFPSNCITLLSECDVKKIKNLITSDWPGEEKINSIIRWLKDQHRKYIFTTPRAMEGVCDVKEIPVKVILHHLEKAGAIKIYPKVIHQVKLIIKGTPSELIKKYPKFDSDLELILNTPSFLNERRKWIILEEIMDQTKLDYFRVKEIFEQLKRDGFFEYADERRKDIIWVQNSIRSFDIWPLVDLFENNRTSKLAKVDLLVSCLRNKECIRKAILRYFDEHLESENCGMCSHCTGSEILSNVSPTIDTNYATDEEICEVEDSLRVVYDDNIKNTLIKLVGLYKIPAKDFTKLVLGELHRLASDRVKKLPCCGMLKGENKDVIDSTIKEIVDGKLINEDSDGLLRLTKGGILYIKNNVDASVQC